MCLKTGVGETDGSSQKPEGEVGEPVLGSDHVDDGAAC
jgi:hypothetical protein